MVHYLIKNQIVPNEDIIFLDFLKLNLSKVFDNEEFYLIGNYPYNISSQILIKMINSRELVPEMVGMFQKEVADRVVAPPGSKTYGVIRLVRKEKYELPCDERLFRNVVKTSFNGRRKMLRNTLKQLFKQSDILEDVFFTQRPEQLSVSDFVDITIKLSNINNNNSEI